MVTKETKQKAISYSSANSIVSVSPVQTMTVWSVEINFKNKEDAEDFAHDIQMLEDPEMIASLKRAESESRAGKSRPIKELFEEYGV